MFRLEKRRFQVVRVSVFLSANWMSVVDFSSRKPFEIEIIVRSVVHFRIFDLRKWKQRHFNNEKIHDSTKTKQENAEKKTQRATSRHILTIGVSPRISITAATLRLTTLAKFENSKRKKFSRSNAGGTRTLSGHQKIRLKETSTTFRLTSLTL